MSDIIAIEDNLSFEWLAGMEVSPTEAGALIVALDREVRRLKRRLSQAKRQGVVLDIVSRKLSLEMAERLLAKVEALYPPPDAIPVLPE